MSTCEMLQIITSNKLLATNRGPKFVCDLKKRDPK